MYQKCYRCSLLLLLGCLFAVTCFSQSWEFRQLESINPQHPNSAVWKGLSGSTYSLVAGVPLGLLAYGLCTHDLLTQRKAYEVLGSVAISAIVSEAIKYSINRERPAEEHPGLIFPYRNEKGKSFPSGHTTLTFATATSLSIQFKKWYVVVPAYVWATAVGYSRLYLGVHYPSDVLGGAAVGAGSALLSNWLCKKLFKPLPHQPVALLY